MIFEEYLIKKATTNSIYTHRSFSLLSSSRQLTSHGLISLAPKPLFLNITYLRALAVRLENEVAIDCLNMVLEARNEVHTVEGGVRTGGAE